MALTMGSGLYSQSLTMSPPPGPPKSKNNTDDDGVFRTVLFDDRVHLIGNNIVQRRFAPMVFTIARNHRSQSSEYASCPVDSAIPTKPKSGYL
jgi:hypothetical protein